MLLQKIGILDGYSYMDMNARTYEQRVGMLEEHQLMDSMIILE